MPTAGLPQAQPAGGSLRHTCQGSSSPHWAKKHRKVHTDLESQKRRAAQQTRSPDHTSNPELCVCGRFPKNGQNELNLEAQERPQLRLGTHLLACLLFQSLDAGQFCFPGSPVAGISRSPVLSVVCFRSVAGRLGRNRHQCRLSGPREKAAVDRG